MGGPYNIPRSYKGEDRILFIFSRKAFVYTAVGGGIGLLLRMLCISVKLNKLGTVMLILFALLGFAVATFKVPEMKKFEFGRKLGGESIDEVIVRWIKFKLKNKKIYVYKEETKDVK